MPRLALCVLRWQIAMAMKDHLSLMLIDAGDRAMMVCLCDQWLRTITHVSYALCDPHGQDGVQAASQRVHAVMCKDCHACRGGRCEDVEERLGEEADVPFA